MTAAQRLISSLRTQGAFAGTMDAVADPYSDLVPTSDIVRWVPSFTAALQAYQIRAAQCGQSFEHMVRLEAAVRGWYVTDPLAVLSSQHCL